MSVSNDTAKSAPLLKILFIGPMGAGKTTAIRCISDSDPIGTEASNSDSGQSTKSTTTVAMDYGSIELGPEEVVHLIWHSRPRPFQIHVANFGQRGFGLYFNDRRYSRRPNGRPIALLT